MTTVSFLHKFMVVSYEQRINLIQDYPKRHGKIYARFCQESEKDCGKSQQSHQQVLTLKWQWVGHVARRTDDRCARAVLDWNSRNIQRPRGRASDRCERHSKDRRSDSVKHFIRLLLVETLKYLSESITLKGQPYHLLIKLADCD